MKIAVSFLSVDRAKALLDEEIPGWDLEAILQDEVNVRNQRQLVRRRKQADFRDARTLEDFDFAFNPSIKRKLVGDVPAASAILDRFLHHAEIIQITGRSYRLKGRAVDKNVVDSASN